MRGTWLIGDSGYPLEPFLMVPFENRQNLAETNLFAKSVVL